jgi:hypothetical protein
LNQEADRWINKYLDKSEISGNFPWTKERAKELGRVPIKELIDDSYYLGMKDNLYPKWKEILYELWDERKKRDINLVCFIAGIGAGKSFVAGVIQFLMVIDLLSKFNPQKYYGLDPDSIIAIMSMSITTGQARKITFGKVYPKIIGSPFFKDYFPPDPRLKREIRIPKAGISIFPGTSSELSALGFDLYGSCLTGDAEILTTDGVKKIKDLQGKRNIKLKSFNVEKDCYEDAVGDKCVYIGEDDIYEIELENGQKIKATENHGFLVRDDKGNKQFKKLKDLRDGDDVVTWAEKDDFVLCPLCGKEFESSLSPHLIGAHGVTVKDILKRFPYIPITTNKHRKRMSESNRGRKPSEETKRKISKANKGRKHTEEAKQKMRGRIPWMKGKKHTEDSRKRISKNHVDVKGENHPMYNRRHIEESKRKMSESTKGKDWEDIHGKEKSDQLKKEMSERFMESNNVHWDGGVSYGYQDYGGEFTEKLKNKIRERDKYTCQLCNEDLSDKRIDVHHIDFCKLHNQESNLISLGVDCHAKVKTKSKRLYYMEFFNSLIKEKKIA